MTRFRCGFLLVSNNKVRVTDKRLTTVVRFDMLEIEKVDNSHTKERKEKFYSDLTLKVYTFERNDKL